MGITVEVPKADASALRMSSLVLVKRAERVPDKDRRRDNPLLVNDVLLYPNLGEPVSKASKEMGFYFVVYPASGKPAPVSRIELLQEGKPVAQQSMPLATADASGRIQQVGRLPLDQLAPGTYELRAVVKQGDEQVVRSALLRIINWEKGRVSDKKGHSVTDLSAADFDVAEDGVTQKVDSFARVTHGAGIGVGVAWRSPRGTVAVMPTDSLSTSPGRDAAVDDATTALVFDHLSTESLRLAQKATLDYVPITGESSMRVGVFATDPGVRVVQRFTTERALVRKAVERLAPSGTTAEEQNTDRTEELIGRRR
jgi:hypothetical protein